MRDEEYLILQNKFRDWFGDPIPADLPLPAEKIHVKKRRRVNKSAKLLELIIPGFGGAIIFGSAVGFIIYILNLSIWRWNSYNWLIQFLVIFFAMVIGFYISLVKVLASQKSER